MLKFQGRAFSESLTIDVDALVRDLWDTISDDGLRRLAREAGIIPAGVVTVIQNCVAKTFDERMARALGDRWGMMIGTDRVVSMLNEAGHKERNEFIRDTTKAIVDAMIADAA